jgi:hypothetical protein
MPVLTKVPESTDISKPEIELGEEHHSEDGGYSFRSIPGYTVEESAGYVTMEAPGADPEVGPAIVMIGALSEESATREELYDGLASDLKGGDIEVSAPREINVDGLLGLVADISGTFEGEDVAGRIVIVVVTPTRHFIMLGVAPVDHWEDEMVPLFVAVLGSVHLSEPSSSPITTSSPVMPTSAPVCPLSPVVSLFDAGPAGQKSVRISWSPVSGASRYSLRVSGNGWTLILDGSLVIEDTVYTIDWWTIDDNRHPFPPGTRFSGAVTALDSSGSKICESSFGFDR